MPHVAAPGPGGPESLPSNARAASTRWDQSKPVAVSGRGIRPGSAHLDLSDKDPSENQNSSKQERNQSVSRRAVQGPGGPSEGPRGFFQRTSGPWDKRRRCAAVTPKTHSWKNGGLWKSHDLQAPSEVGQRWPRVEGVLERVDSGGTVSQPHGFLPGQACFPQGQPSESDYLQDQSLLSSGVTTPTVSAASFYCEQGLALSLSSLMV